MIKATYFQVTGPAVMIVPQVDDATPVRFTMRGFPSAWSLASDLEHPDLTQKALLYSVIVGGDYRVLRGARDPNIRLAIRGAWTFKDEDLLRELETILEGQRRLWGDPSRPYFKVEQLPYQRGRLFATLIDARLRARGRDLDDVLLEMRRRAPTAGMYAPALFAAVMADMGTPVDEDVRTYIERGEPILLPEDTFAPCGVLATRGVRQQLLLDPDLDDARNAACLSVLGGAESLPPADAN